ncbi:MAG: hypothetical protein B6U94_06850 [Thermofilum sp. ex4484_79]|nr:MAG: hypothetical protein B6U94_06850 [Thermofilum sp. ex4484_79]
MSVEELRERLIRIEALLNLVLQRLNEIEKTLGSPNVQLVKAGVKAYGLTLKTFKEIATIYSYLGDSSIIKDEITRLIIQILAEHGDGLNISQITRELRKIRGKASRRIVRGRLAKLVSMGIIEEVSGWGKVFKLVKKGVDNTDKHP